MTIVKHKTLGQIIGFRSFVFGIILAIGVYLAILILGDWDTLLINLFRVNPLILVLAILLSLTNYIFRFFKWHLFTRSLNLEIPLRDNFTIFMAGLSLAITPAKVGESIRAFLLQQKKVSDLSRGLASTFSERLIDLLAVTILAIIGVFALDLRPSLDYLPLLLFILFGIFFGVLIFLIDPLYALFSRVFNTGPWAKFGARIDRFRTDVVFTFQYRVFIGALGFGIIGWACEGIGFMLIANDLGVLVTLETAIFVYATSSLLGAISFLPGGLGVTEGSIEIFLSDLLSTEPPIAGALIILTRVCTLWFGVAIGLVFLGISNRSLSGLDNVERD
ncbi:MAG: YbhN family protein [Candidatus Heimdallarchaeota archaeon]